MNLLLILAVLVCGYYGYVFARNSDSLALIDAAAACRKLVASTTPRFRNLFGLVKK